MIAWMHDEETTMRWMTLRYVLALTVCSGLVACGGTDGGPADGDPSAGGQFDDRDDESDTTTVTGRALTAEEEPAADVTVFVRTESGKSAQTTTGQDGRFELQGAPVGEGTLVFNDGAGRGAVEPLTLQADGTHQAGDVLLEPLPEIPRIVDIPNVGFEERVSTGQGNYYFPVYTTDTSRVFAARKLDGDDTWSVVEIETSTGDEQVLASDLKLDTLDGLYSADSEEPHREVFELVGDRHLLWRANDELTIYDVHDDEVAYDTEQLDAHLYHRVPAVTSEAVVLPMIFERDKYETLSHRYQMKLYKFDRETEQVVEGPSPGREWVDNLSVEGVGDGVVVYTVNRTCRNREGELTTFCDAGDNPYFSRLRALDLGEMTLETLARNEDNNFEWRAHVVEGTSVVYRTKYDDTKRATIRVVRQDLEAGTTSSQTFQGCGDCSQAENGPGRPMLAVGDNSDQVYVSWPTRPVVEHEDYTEYVGRAFARWDVEAGDRTRLESTVSVDGSTRKLCENGRCEVAVVGGDRLRIRHAFERSDGDWWGVIVDFEGTSRVDTRLIDLSETDGEPASFDSAPGFREKVVTASGSDVEAVRLRRGETGFFQYSIRGADDRSDPEGFVRRTFLRAHHDHAAFAPDGGALFYFTRDPISGYRQLFRMRVGSLPGTP
jgi:hypothetical protein